ncbi:MAG: mechanosensitive ion channel family protein, partial [Cyanobacteria bacterium REEB65]|nr:mechanosensitive ion channel family protein [Cyanobacteria bacterium REEB65]
MLSNPLQAAQIGYSLLAVIAIVVLGLPFYRLVIRRTLLFLFKEDPAGGMVAVKRLARVYVVMLVVLALEVGRSTAGIPFGGEFGPWLDRLLPLAVALFSIEIFRVVVIDFLAVSRRKNAVPKILRDIGAGLLYVVVTLAFLSQFYNLNLTPILTFSGLFSIVLGMALQDTLGNLFSGLAINLEPPFAIGDWVQIEGEYAQIKEITWRATKALTRRHELVILPNSTVAKAKITNYSQPSSVFALEIVVGVVYDAPPAPVMAALHSCVDQSDRILAFPPPTVRMVKFDDSSIDYRIRFFIDRYESRGHVIDDLHSRIWYKFQQLGYGFAFPTRTIVSPDAAAQQSRDL